MTPDDYIREFFATIKTYLSEVELKSSGRHAKYKNSSITADWAGDLWNVELHDDVLGPMKRVYDPAIARSAETAAVPFIDALRKALVPGGTVIIATFALDGPEKCSGLPVQRYSPETLAKRLGQAFQIVSSVPERHATPWGTTQSFSYAAFQRH